MGDIVYWYKENIYLNITNKCPCRCKFCIRGQKEAIGEAKELWHEKEPTLEEIEEAIDVFGIPKGAGVVFCGYGEPLERLDELIAVSRYLKETYGASIRVNTNGLGNLIHGRDIVPELCQAVDSVSVSLNMPDAKSYCEIVRPKYGEKSFDEMLKFAVECRKYLEDVRFSVVDVIGVEQVKKSRILAEKLGIPLRVRHYSQ